MARRAIALEFRGSLLSWFSLLAMPITGSWFSHGRILTSDGTVVESIGSDGVIERDRPEDDRPPLSWVYRLDLGFLPAIEQAAIYDRAAGLKGLPYDDRYLAGYILNRPMGQENALVCFEVLTRALAPVITVDKAPHRIAARHIIKAVKAAAREA